MSKKNETNDEKSVKVQLEMDEANVKMLKQEIVRRSIEVCCTAIKSCHVSGSTDAETKLRETAIKKATEMVKELSV